MRSAIVFTLCLWRRHFADLVFIAQWSAPVWNHAGSCCFSSWLRRIVEKLALWSRAAFSILIVSG